MSIIEEVVSKIEDWQGKDISIKPLSGGLTNTIAIWMLFHPYTPRGISRLKLQGAIPKNKPRLAKTINAMHADPARNWSLEDLAATAVWGSQQAGLYPSPRFDGVFGIWYGKGPGVDRSMDALKHANSAGTSPNGGVIALAGDDHGCQSSTLAHQSEQVFAAALMPVPARNTRSCGRGRPSGVKKGSCRGTTACSRR